MRGVMWRSAELDSARVWSQLSQSWAIPFCPQQLARFDPDGNGNASQEQIMSHKGITDMADELYGIIWEHLKAHQGPQHAFRESANANSITGFTTDLMGLHGTKHPFNVIPRC